MKNWTADSRLVAFIVVASTAALVPNARSGELPGTELCKLLTAEETTNIVGSPRTAKADEARCTYENPNRPALRLMNSSSESRDAYVALATAMKAEVKDGPAGSVMYSAGFDQKNGKISGAWFPLKSVPVELEFDGGLEAEKVTALIEAARK